MTRPYIDAQTKVCALFGHPVKHSFSPVMHNTAFKHLGLNFVYAAFDILPENLEVAMDAVRILNLAGVNLTIPHKERVINCLDSMDRAAELTGAVNTVVHRDGRLHGYNTDGSGFIRSLQEDCSLDANGKVVLLVGAGGAARAVGMQLALSGVSQLGILNRDARRGALLAGSIQKFTGVQTSVVPWPREKHPAQEEELCRFFKAADLVVNCTSMGMKGSPGQLPPLPYHLAVSGQAAYDLVYNPGRTRFMEKFMQAGCTAANGLGMLLHQGALAFELWTGQKAPLDIMRKTLHRCLAQ